MEGDGYIEHQTQNLAPKMLAIMTNWYNWYKTHHKKFIVVFFLKKGKSGNHTGNKSTNSSKKYPPTEIFFKVEINIFDKENADSMLYFKKR